MWIYLAGWPHLWRDDNKSVQRPAVGLRGDVAANMGKPLLFLNWVSHCDTPLGCGEPLCFTFSNFQRTHATGNVHFHPGGGCNVPAILL